MNKGLLLDQLENTEKLKSDTINLKEITEQIISNHKRDFYENIKLENNKYYDGLHLEFIHNNKDLNFDEIQLVKKVFDFLKDQD
ncbi:MAG: hypothetical protein RSC24_06515 [Clostridium sp.]